MTGTGGPPPTPESGNSARPAGANGAVPAGANGARPAAGAEADVWDKRVAAGLAFLRRRLSGQYEVDEFGFDPELTEQLFHPILRLLYRDWFRTEVSGVENLPVDGPALVVGNHSGTVALELAVAGVPTVVAYRFAGVVGTSRVRTGGAERLRVKARSTHDLGAVAAVGVPCHGDAVGVDQR